MNIKTFFSKYSEFVYKSRLRAMGIEIAIVFVLQLVVDAILFDGADLGDVIVAFVVALFVGVSSGNLFYELHKKKGLI
jgi:uncharacterized membrane protein YccC